MPATIKNIIRVATALLALVLIAKPSCGQSAANFQNLENPSNQTDRNSWMTEFVLTSSSFEESIKAFPFFSSLPCEQIEFCEKILQAQRHLQFENVDFATFYRFYGDALRSCPDKELVLNSLVSFSTEHVGDFPESIPLEWVTAELREYSDRFNSERGRFALCLLTLRSERRLSRDNKDVDKLSGDRFIEAMKACKRHAELSNDDRLLMLAYRELSLLNVAYGKYDEAESNLLSWIAYAKRINDASMNLESATHLALLYRRSNRRSSGTKVIESSEKETAFARAASYHKSGHAFTGAIINEELGDEDKRGRYTKSSKEHESEAQFALMTSKVINAVFGSKINDRRPKGTLPPHTIGIPTSPKHSLIQYLFWLLPVLGLLAVGIGLVAYRIRLNSRNEKISYDKERELLRAKVSHMQKMDSLSMMAGGIAHDFNNLLVGVMSNAEVIQLRSANDEFIDKRTKQIIHSAEKASELSRQMLAYAGKQAIKRQPLCLNALVSRVVENIKKGNQREIETEYASSESAIDADKIQIEQVVTNLISNSFRASDPESVITVRTGIESVLSVDQNVAVVSESFAPGDHAYIEVEDSGCGIDESNLQRIFEPFFSKNDDSRGLGLAVVYGVVVRHDGLIRIESTPNVKTCFRVLIPASKKPLTAESEKPNARKDSPNTGSIVPKPKLQKRRGSYLLVVDDKPNVLKAVSQILQLRQWNVATASGGAKAIKVLEKHQSKIKGVILDIHMPVVGGEQVLEAMTKLNIEIPVIVMSGFSQTRMEVILDHPLVVAGMSKPFHISELLKLVRESFGIAPQRSVGSNTTNTDT